MTVCLFFFFLWLSAYHCFGINWLLQAPYVVVVVVVSFVSYVELNLNGNELRRWANSFPPLNIV